MLTYMIILFLSDFRERGNQPTSGFRTKTESRGLRGGMTICSTIFFLVFLGGRDSRLSSHRDCFSTAAPNNRKKKTLCFPNVFTYLVSVNSLHLVPKIYRQRPNLEITFLFGPHQSSNDRPHPLLLLGP